MRPVLDNNEDPSEITHRSVYLFVRHKTRLPRKEQVA
jgi:hypothetical protein